MLYCICRGYFLLSTQEIQLELHKQKGDWGEGVSDGIKEGI